MSVRSSSRSRRSRASSGSGSGSGSGFGSHAFESMDYLIYKMRHELHMNLNYDDDQIDTLENMMSIKHKIVFAPSNDSESLKKLALMNATLQNFIRTKGYGKFSTIIEIYAFVRAAGNISHMPYMKELENDIYKSCNVVEREVCALFCEK